MENINKLRTANLLSMYSNVESILEKGGIGSGKHKSGSASFGSFKDHSHEELSKLHTLAKQAKDKNSRSEKLSEEEQHAMDNHADVQSELEKRGIKKSDDHETEGFQKLENEVLVTDFDEDNEVKKSFSELLEDDNFFQYCCDKNKESRDSGELGDLSEEERNRLMKSWEQDKKTYKNPYQDVKKSENDDLEKGGEGSRGGKIIGHTKSGKAIYADKFADHEDYKEFTSEDHSDAHKLHHGIEWGPKYRQTKNVDHGKISSSHFLKKSNETDLEKGGKRAQIGEVRNYGGVNYVKHVDGWVFQKKNGEHHIELPGGKRQKAEKHHEEHFQKHFNNSQSTEKKEYSFIDLLNDDEGARLIDTWEDALLSYQNKEGHDENLGGVLDSISKQVKDKFNYDLKYDKKTITNTEKDSNKTEFSELEPMTGFQKITSKFQKEYESNPDTPKYLMGKYVFTEKNFEDSLQKLFKKIDGKELTVLGNTGNYYKVIGVTGLKQVKLNDKNFTADISIIAINNNSGKKVQVSNLAWALGNERDVFVGYASSKDKQGVTILSNIE